MAATKASAARNTRTKKKERKNIAAGTAHIQSTFNNTIVTITTHHIGQYGKRRARIFEQQRPSASGAFRFPVGQFRDFEFGIDLRRDTDQFAGPFERMDIIGKISVHDFRIDDMQICEIRKG